MAQRTQITLPDDQHRKARARAGELGISLAEYVRRLVARDLGGHNVDARVDSLFDLGSSEQSDVASSKDRMVGEAIAARRPAA